MLHNKLHNKKGFTMIELLVVLLIIGILAAVAAPMYLAHTEKARASEAIGVMSLIRSAEREWATVHNNTFLTVSGSTIAADPGSSPAGLGVRVGPAQYFAIESFSVTAGNGSMGAGNNSATAEDFLILANGANANNNATNIVRNGADVSGYRVQMDNSGLTLFSTDSGSTWKKY